MKIEDYEALSEEDKEAVEADARNIAWDYISDHSDGETEEENQEWEDDNWPDFIKDVD